jgi:arylsulfatase A-like enzyme
MALASGGHWEVSPDVTTLPALLRESGYATACYGTWHISADFAEHGVETGDQDADGDRAASNAIEYLRHRPVDRPFFLMVGTNKPHRPFTGTWPDLQEPGEVIVPGYLVDTPDVRDEMVHFYGEVSRMDASVGAILEALRDLGLDESTVVVFTSDHGIGMPLAKGTLYDPGLKIPLIIRWPEHVRGGRRCSDLTANVDLLPTLLEAVGEHARTPSDLDGHSLWPYVKGNADVSHPAIYPEQTWHDFYEPIRAIRTTRYKLIRNYEPGTGWQIAADILHTPTVDAMRDTLRNWPRPSVELYDLIRDPWERHNLAGSAETRDIESTLAGQLDDWLASTGDPILDGVVPAPPGYWEHFCAKPNGPGALPPAAGCKEWLTIRWPSGATRHHCRS